MGIRKRIASLSILLSLLLTASSAQAAQPPQTIEVTNVTPIQYLFDGVFYEPPAGQEGFLYQNWTYVPLRFMAEMLGSVVEWDGETNTVVIRLPETDEEKQQAASTRQGRKAKNQAPSKAKPAVQKKPLKVYKTPVKYIFFNEEKEPGSEWIGINLNGRIYVPLRFVTESMGWEIEFDQASFTIKADAPAANHDPAGEGKDAQQDGNAGQAPPGGMGGAGPAGPGGGSFGGGGGGNMPAVSYDRIISEHEKKISDLKLSCHSKLYNLYAQYLEATDEEVRNNLIDQGWSALGQCDANFNAIMSSLESQLTSNGYSTDVISTYREQYETEKNNALMQLMK